LACGEPIAVADSTAIAAKHYLQVTDEHFDRAVATIPGTPGHPASPETPNNGSPTTGDGTAPKNAAQNAAQQVHAGARKGSHEKTGELKNPAICGALLGVASGCEDPNKTLIPPRGVEPLFAD
jgi:hypothetical protein